MIENGDLPASPIFGENGLATLKSNLETDIVGDPKATGLTKREKFAMAAMQGVLSDSRIMNLIRVDDDKDTAEFMAGLAVEYADALLSALEE